MSFSVGGLTDMRLPLRSQYIRISSIVGRTFLLWESSAQSYTSNLEPRINSFNRAILSLFSLTIEEIYDSSITVCIALIT